MSAPVRTDRLVLTGADGNRLVATSWGSGPPALLLHGGGQTRHSWDRVGPTLARAGRTAIALDLRGHGDSDWSADPEYTLHTHARDLRAVCAVLGGRPSLIGASMGGIAALLAAGENPDGGRALASCLVLVDVTPRMEAAGVSRIRDFMLAAPDGFASLEQAADSIAAYQPGRRRPSSTAGLAKNLRLGPDGRYRWHWDPRILDAMPGDPSARHDVLTAAARAIAIPTLLVRGGRSDVVSAEGVRELKELVPHSEFVEVTEAGHMVAGDANDQFGDAIAEFVGRH
jgi:non-heme chloroperoxidase